MKKNKSGFTLSEVLVSMVIIGVIMAISANSIKIVKTSYTSLAYFAYNNIVNMVGVLNSGEKVIQDNGGTLPSLISQCRSSNGKVVQVLKTDNEYYNDNGVLSCSARKDIEDETSNLFCNAMVSMANTSGKTDCNNLYSVLYNGTEPYISDLNVDKPNFIATNGQRYYISKWQFNDNVSDEYGFRLIAVDLNSSSRPNSTTKQGGLPPDIITFLILDNGEVFPLGVAADNITISGNRVIKYLNSKVKGYYYEYNSARTENVASECTKKINGVTTNVCNYAIVPLQNENGATINGKKTSFFSFRQAYCTALGGNSTVYENYCTGISASELCPPTTNSQGFDLCLATNVKPMFRYNFK
jgi:prepilin-type N-terminal cleavage/methylation domain-containing protein